MNVMVVDASVAAKWFLSKEGETLTDEALELFRRCARGEIRFVVPDLFWAEMANIFWKATRQGRCTKTSAETALVSLQQNKLTTIPSLTLLKSAFSIATTSNRSVYDSLYVALAVLLNIYLVTADERLANALAASLPVKWLGAI
jgi:predicted nucleic acid-binding protein